MRDFYKLQVWEKSHCLAIEIYEVTRNFPKGEIFGLTNQIRRAVISISSNIAEGCGRDGNIEFRRFLEIASGSASEVEYQLLLSRDLGYLDAKTYASLNAKVIEIKMMLFSFRQSLKTSN